MTNSAFWQKLTSEDNLYSAWLKVAGNMGAGGVDRVSIEDFQLNLYENLNVLRGQLEREEYKPLPLLKIRVDKPVGGKRTLGIPTIRDRIIQQALVNILEPIFEPEFADCSYAYRPKRSAHKALNRVEKYLKQGCDWIFESDIASFFDSLNHQLLIRFIEEKIQEPRIINLINSILEAASTTDKTGIPQGAVTSPLFSNIYLHQFDRALVENGYNLVRFADDFVVLTKNRDKAEEALRFTRGILSQLSLRLNEKKTRVLNLGDGFIFLGYEFTPLGRRPSKDALSAFIKKVVDVAPSKEERSEIEQKAKLQAIIQGWLNYFKLDATSHKELIRQLEVILKENPDSFPAHLTLSLLHLVSDNPSKAKELINNSLVLSSADPMLYFQRAMVSEELGMVSCAVDDYLTAFRLNPENPDIAYRLGLYCLHKNSYDKAVKYFQRALQIDPSFVKAKYALGVIYQKWGLAGLAKRFFEEASSLNTEMTSQAELEILTEQKVEFDPDSFRDEDILHFLKLFQGREGVYARQWIDNKDRCGYIPVREPLSYKEIKAHLSGDLTIGLYLIRADNTVKMMVIDIDFNKGALARYSKEMLDKAICEDAERVKMIAERVDCPAYIEDSGHKGRHLWFFFCEPIRADIVREFGRAILKEAGEPPPNIHREIFPMQDRLSKDGLGSLIKLPLDIHLGTQSRCLFIDSSGKPHPDQVQFLRDIELISTPKIKEALIFLKAGPERMIQVEGQEIKKVIEGCNVIRFLINKAKDSHHLTHIERLVLLYSLGHIEKEYIHQVMSHCLNYNQRLTQRWINRLNPEIRPISCPKIRDWLSYITPGVGCYCEFKLSRGAYPSPLLYARPEMTRGLAAKRPLKEIPARGGESVDLLVKEYVGLKKERGVVEIRIREVENRINELLDSRGIDSFPTDLGILRRVRKEDQIAFMIEI